MPDWRIAILPLLALSACAPKSVEDRRIEDATVPLSYATLPAPTQADGRTELRSTFLGPNDLLKVEIFGIEELSREVRIDSAGFIDFPLAGQIEAAGMTKSELARALENRLRGAYVRDPQVTINVSEAASQLFTATGGVNSPGNYSVVGNMTLIRAVAAAGGLSDTAISKDVIVFRTVNGQELAGLYNLAGIEVGNYPDPLIYAGDRIVVNSRSTNLDPIFQGLQNALPLIIIADRILN